ncbi:endonuclease III [Aerococcaceae bacterium DSM 111021]|nr:endonuclease III [Aerococcaceae bacterium DSM 111021]
MTLNSEEVLDIIHRMDRLIPDAKSELDYKDPFHMLIAVMLSAQSTDKQVNKIAPALFEAYPDAETMSQASAQEIESYIKTLGLYRNKAKYMVSAAADIVNNFQGEIPNNRKDLVSLSGVGRKTANVVLSVIFDTPAIAVDTHVERVCKRLNIVPKDATPLQVEKILMEKLPEEYWSHAHQLLVLFGRYYCTARSKKCIEYLEEV